jgi:hypothetical protein
LTQNKNPLVVFGCSWAYGTGVTPKHCFGSVLSEIIGSTQYTNCGIPGSSNSRSVLELLEYIEKNNSEVNGHIAIFSITTAWRTSLIYNNGTILDIIDKEVADPLIKIWIDKFRSEKNLQYELHKNILSMQQICRHHGIKDYYIKAWENPNLNLSGINQSRIFPKTCVDLFGYKDTEQYIKNWDKGNNPYVLSCGHPSIEGHKKIAQTLYNWIKEDLVQSQI